MPELPEVQVVVDGLNELVLSKQIVNVDYDWEKSFPNEMDRVKEHLLDHYIENIERRGKAIIAHLSSGHYLLIHLRMTGQLVFVGEERFAAGHPNDSMISKLPDSSTRVIFMFDDKSRLYFNDQRKFGFIKLLNEQELKRDKFLNSLGPEPLKPKFNAQVLEKRLQKRPGTTIKAALLDQKVLAGLGNIYVDEALWCAQIHPKRQPKTLEDEEIKKLSQCIKKVLKISLEKGGSTDRNYVDARGKKGSYLDFANVFRKEGEDCPRCGDKIVKTRVAGRGTHYCERCQG